jgi:KUP system potassium uptake protein
MSDPGFYSSRDSIVAVAPPVIDRRHGGPPSTGPEPLDEHHGHLATPAGRRLAILTLTALGVVYGDIGTSPLYTMKEAFGAERGLAPTPVNVYGVLSLVFWAIVLVVVVKYLVFILRADNHGEGGVLALLALVLQRQHRTDDRRRRALFVILGVLGTALLFGDGIITPAISVLGAVEGVEIATPALSHYVVPITMGILLLLFMVQRFGTAKVGRAFGPITLMWFLVIGALGLAEILRAPRILAAVNPVHAARLFTEHGFVGFAALGAVFLAVTGAEALYADMGHFGRRPIKLAFFSLVLPALLLNYFGQGALLLRRPEAVANPFYLLAPRWALYPLLLIATLAAIVASQALISGVFSLAQQAVQLGSSPRTTIVHTSAREHGQIYVPQINKLLMIGTLVIVAGFKSSGALASAYGIAVTGTMLITTLLFAVVARTRWGWPLWRVIALDGSLSRLRPRLPRRERAEDRPGRMGPARDRDRRADADDDVEAGARIAARDHARPQPADRAAARGDRAPSAAARRGHGGVPHERRRRARRWCCCITSSTTRRCTSRWCCCR